MDQASRTLKGYRQNYWTSSLVIAVSPGPRPTSHLFVITGEILPCHCQYQQLWSSVETRTSKFNIAVISVIERLR